MGNGNMADGSTTDGEYGDLTDAVRAVRLACRVTRSLQDDLRGAFLTKEDRSPVTVADWVAQALISLTLPEDDAIVGEETSADIAGSGLMDRVVEVVAAEFPGADADRVAAAIDRCSATGGATGRFWVLDPIDGTKGFLRGAQYAVALGLMEDGEVVGGVLGCPNLPVEGDRGCVFVARRGHGAWELPVERGAGEARRIGVSSVDDPAQAVFCESAVSMHSNRGGHADIAERLGVTAEPVRMDSQCKYAAMARGDASIYLRLPSSATYREKIWDHAAGLSVVTEAGGTVTDAFGRKLDFSLGRTLDDNRGVVATNGLLHERVLKAAAAGSPAAPTAGDH